LLPLSAWPLELLEDCIPLVPASDPAFDVEPCMPPLLLGEPLLLDWPALPD
jgi:hypothetical protein